jgi:hypothetical protein
MKSKSRVELLYNSLGMSNWVKSVRQTKGAKEGFTLLTLTFGSYFYYNYIQNRVFNEKYGELENKLYRTHAIDLNSLIWYNTQMAKYDNHLSRMTEHDYNERYFMQRCSVTGSFDHSKEILVPRKRNFQEGYYVFTPFYYADFTMPVADDDIDQNAHDDTYYPDKYIQKDAVIVNRGW